ncbi:TB2/DP1, HVA22 family-domain-containing protein, partial [Vararia minispora EC-137]
MFTSFVSHLLCGWFAFLLPSYKMFKALKHRPVSEPELERWAAYWSVIGAIVAFEYAAEWAVSWIPFYWELKTILLLFLSLPQTEGSRYIYKSYLEPYYLQHEADIDQSIESVQTEGLAWLQAHLARLWEVVYSILSKTPIPEKVDQPPSQGGSAGSQNLSQGLQNLWSTYGPAIMGAL